MSELSFKLKKTIELSQEEVSALVEMFKIVMGHDRTEKVFYNQFLNTPFGYSYHVLMYDDGLLIGSHTDIPSYFIVDGVKTLFVTGCDTMIMKKHRDIFNYMDMLAFNRKEMKKIGAAIDYGYPNDLNFTILTKGKLTTVIGHMYTYCLPFRIGGIKHGLRCFNWLSQCFCYCWLSLSSLFASKRVFHFRIEKDLPSFNPCRYKRYDGDYSIQEGFVYKIMEYEGVRTAFLIDVFEKSPYNFCKAVKYIFKNDRKNFDILLYPGYLPFSVTGMVRIPHKFEPKHFHMTAKILDNTSIDKELIFDINNWDTNLSNYDLI